ncbi:MAG: hypothetical protein M0Z81_11785 [Deltaproteobacteria bacterium]|jgi:uncharacterized phage infection (PIP) family protein YhgE|nr:hypothetical protein [Deltaproteobacteria bacterium]
MELTISVRIKSRRGADLIRGQYRHDLREWHVPRYVDRTRSNQNSHIGLAVGYAEKPGALVREFDRRLTAAKKTGRTAEVLTGVVTFSKGAQKLVENLSRTDQDMLFKTVVEYVAAKMDVPANYVRIHRDESAIHGHFSLLNVTSKGRTYRGGRGDMSKLQDVAAQACQELGYDIKRGKSKLARIKDGEESSKYINRTVRQLHEALPKEIAALESERNALAEKVRAMDESLSAAEAQLAADSDRIAEQERKIQDNERRLQAATQKLAALSAQGIEEGERIEKLKKNAAIYGQRVEKLKKQWGDYRELWEQMQTQHGRIDDLEREKAELKQDRDRYKRILVAQRRRQQGGGISR